MKEFELPSDDIYDVIDMSKNIEKYIRDLLKEIPTNLAISTILSACANSLLQRSASISEFMFYGNAMMDLMEQIVDAIETEA